MLDELVHGRRADGDLTLYMDAFDPPGTIPAESVRLAGTKIIPPLLAALSDRGLSAFVTHDLGYLETIRAQSDGRMQLVKLNDRTFHPNANRDDTNVLLLARGDQLVGSIASRMLWCEGTLAEELESGRFWVSDPATMWTPDDKCVVTANAARTIGACSVVHCGSIYLDPSVRGGLTLAAFSRLHFLWLVCHWRWSWLVGFVEGNFIYRYALNLYGNEIIEQGMWLTRDDGELHHYHMGLNRRRTAMEAWLRPEMGDLSRPMGRPPRAILPKEAPDQVTEARRAHA